MTHWVSCLLSVLFPRPPETSTDLSILDALCGIDGEEPGDEGLSDDDDDDSYDAQG